MLNELETDGLRLIVESLPTGMIIVDQKGRIVSMNRQVEVWFGYERQEIISQVVEILVPDRYHAMHPAQRDTYFQAPRIRPMGASRDLYARRRDGSEFPCDISLHPLPLSSGMHVLVHIVDATERRTAESLQRHQESLRRMQFMVENLPAGAIYVSLDTQTLMVNRAFEEMTGYTQSDLEGFAHAFDLLFRDRAEEVLHQHRQDQVAGFPSPRVLMIHRKDGKRAWVENATYRYNNHEVWLWHDVTERLASQERLLQSTRLAAIGEMMTGLAHESRNALQRARAALEMLDLDLEQRPDLQTLSQRATSAIEELQRLYEEVRNYASPIQLERRLCDLREVWEEAWIQVQQVHRDKLITMTSNRQSPVQLVNADCHRMNQVFRNIFENAVAVLPEHGGEVYVTSQVIVEDGMKLLEISIRDNGPGMNEEQRGRIFEPFYTTKTRGTGLGMAIVRRIMESHGGSTSVGHSKQGAVILLRLPMKMV